MSFLKYFFKSTQAKSGIVFIVEDNPVYAKTLERVIKESFPEIKEVKIFSVGETCLLELDKNPDIIIVDYFLDTKYQDAETGIEIIKKIRVKKPEMNIVVLSAQKEIEVMLEAVKIYQCSYVKKDEQAFDRIEEVIKDFYKKN
jgi:two-component system OmpR family response regulator